MYEKPRMVLENHRMEVRSVKYENNHFNCMLKVMVCLFVDHASVPSNGLHELLSPISGIPANRFTARVLPRPKSDLVPIDVSRLGQEPPRTYHLDKGDILGIYIEGILPFNAPDQPPTAPPVHFPQADSTLPPSMGYPIAVQDDGTIALPLIRPINVKGMSVEQAREVIRRAYLDGQILKDDGSRIVSPIVNHYSRANS